MKKKGCIYHMNCFQRLGTVLRLAWNYFRLMPQLWIGGWRISRLPHPAVTIFGGGRLHRDSSYIPQARELARRLSEAGISIITGGGPGIMEAANCGAIDPAPTRITMGVAVRGINDAEPKNPCVTSYFMTDFFLLRKYLLIYYSHAFITFPGGFGTLDEIFEVLTLMQTKKLPVMPVIFVGVDYWKDLVEWIRVAVKEGLVPQEHADYIVVSDDLENITKLVAGYCKSPECERWKHRSII